MTTPRVSNTNQRATTGDRKVAFKNVLDNPFKVNWPYIPYNVQQATLTSLVTILADVGVYNLKRRAAAGKQKRARDQKERKQKICRAKRRKVGDMGEAIAVDNNDVGTTPQNTLEQGNSVIEAVAEPNIQVPPAPPIVSHLTIGINEVTRRLESQAQSRRLHTSIHASTPDSAGTSSAPDSKPERAFLAYVFVCRADIDPPLLVAHLPELIASCNTPIPSVKFPPVHLITLPKQAESTLAEIVGLRRVSVLAFDSAAPSLTALSTLLADIQPPSASWLTGPVTYIPTHIKQLRTTVPGDMRAAKQARTEGRRAAKEKNKLKFGSKNRSNKTNKAGLKKAVAKEAKVKSVKAVAKEAKVKSVKAKVKPSKDLKRVKVVSSATAAVQDPLPK